MNGRNDIMDIKSGDRFGKLVVINIFDSRKKGYFKYECACDCGNVKTFEPNQLLRGRKSCGCLRRTHNMSGTRIYNIWFKMKKRCDDKNTFGYEHYGGRGITYDMKWSTFEGFYEDMKKGYSDSLSIDRIDVNGNYCKSNCRWADDYTQMNNTTRNTYVTYEGETLSAAEMSRKYKLNYRLFRSRLEKGMSVEDAMKPAQKKEELFYKGEKKTVAEWAFDYGMTYHQLKKRLMSGWDIERALNQSIRIAKRKNS